MLVRVSPIVTVDSVLITARREPIQSDPDVVNFIKIVSLVCFR